MSTRTTFWFRRRYNLPPNDPRFLSLTDEEIAADYWAHQYYDDPKMADADHDDDFDIDAIEAEINSGMWERLRGE